MMRLRRKADQTAAEDSPLEAAAPQERRSGLLAECWADLRGRPRPTVEPMWEEEEPRSVPVGGGVGLDEEGMRRLRARYDASSN